MNNENQHTSTVVEDWIKRFADEIKSVSSKHKKNDVVTYHDEHDKNDTDNKEVK